MAALTRPSKATYACHENVTVDTNDRQDHTFCGIMFPVEVHQDARFVENVTVTTLSVRGRLGPITVWVSGAEFETDVAEEEELRGRRRWRKVHDCDHSPSKRHYAPLELSPPVTLQPGQQCIFYVHSALASDQSIVYDNARKAITYQDDIISIRSGRAHLSMTPFSNQSLWGYQGAWRENRAFVGRIEYGLLYKLWNPHVHSNFGSSFDRMVMTLLLCQRRYESPMSMLPDEVLYYILNMCGMNFASGCKVQESNAWTLSRRLKSSSKKSSTSSDNGKQSSTKKSLVRKLLRPLLGKM